MPREIVLRQRLDRAAGHAVVGRHHGRDVVVRRLDGLQREDVGLRGQPVLHETVADDVNVAALDVRLQDFLLRLAQGLCAFVVRRAGDQHVVAFGRVRHQVFGLHAADRHAVEGDVQIDAAVLDQPVVADHADMRGFGGVHHAAGFRRVVRQQHQSLDARLDHVLHLLELQIVVALGVGGDNFGAKLLRARLESVEVGLPPLAVHRLDGEADLEGRLRVRGVCGDGQSEDGSEQRQAA